MTDNVSVQESEESSCIVSRIRSRAICEKSVLSLDGLGCIKILHTLLSISTFWRGTVSSSTDSSTSSRGIPSGSASSSSSEVSRAVIKVSSPASELDSSSSSSSSSSLSPSTTLFSFCEEVSHIAYMTYIDRGPVELVASPTV